MVHVPPVEVVAARYIIELVAEVSVAIVKCHLEDE
jgi:hypothetical protein